MSDEREVGPGIPGLDHLKKNQVVEPWDPTFRIDQSE
jgi:hypothetical protein